MTKPDLTTMSELLTHDGEFVRYRAVESIEMVASRQDGRYFLIRGETVLPSTPSAELVVSEVLDRWTVDVA